MAMNMDAILRITAKTHGLQDIANMNDAVQELGISSEKTGRQIKESSEQGREWKAIVGIAGLTAGLTFATKSAVEFETGMSDVRKVVEGLESPKELGKISEEILSLSQSMPITAQGLAEIYAAAGQSGIAKTELKDFSILVAEVGTAFDLTAQEAGTSLSQIKTALSLTTPQLSNLADAMNYVENNTGATARGLIDFMARSGSVGKIAGLASNQTLAFGAAMTQAGVDSDIAATSFNNMIKALSRGPSMTERQIEALKRLGYGMKSAADIEKQLTAEAEDASKERIRLAKNETEQSIRLAEKQYEERLKIAQSETDELLEEISKRYREEQRIIENRWEDQDIAQERAQDKAFDSRIKAIERERREEIKAARQRQKDLGQENESEIETIQDRYDETLDIERQSYEDRRRIARREIEAQREMTLEQQRQREENEKKQAQRRYQQQQEAEQSSLAAIKKAQEQRLKTVEDSEAKLLDKSKQQAKLTGEAVAQSYAQSFADRLQKDGVGTISEVLTKINQLPKSQQISVMTDLFGDEARGLAPLLSNLDELKRILALVAEEQKYLGSTTEEASVRFQTSASKLQVFNNNITALKIAVGDTLLPLLLSILEPLKNIVAGVTMVTNSIKGFVSAIVERTVLLSVFSKAILSLTGFVISLGIALGGLMSLATLNRWAGGIKLLALVPGPLRLIAIALSAIGLAATPLGPVLSAIGTALLVIQGIKFAVSVIQGVTAMTAALSGLLAWIGGTLIPGLLAFFSGPVGWTVLAVAAVVAMAIAFREPLEGFVKWLWEWGKPIRQFWADLGTGIVQGIGNVFKTVISLFTEKLAKPLGQKWNEITADPKKFFDDTTEMLKGFYRGVSDVFSAIFKEITAPFDAAGRYITAGFSQVVAWMARTVNTWIDGINSLIQRVNDLPTVVGQVRWNIPEIPSINVPQLANGGWFNRSTLAEIGEGGDPGGEYAIPASRMPQAIQAWQGGARGNALVAAMQSPGLAPGRGGVGPAYSAPSSAPPVVNITVRPGMVMQSGDGRQWLSADDLPQIIAATMQAMGRR